MSEEVYLFPTSFAQQRLWFLDQLVPGNPFYNISTGIPLKLPLNRSIFEKCVNEIVSRHDVLRTSFAVVNGEPFQVVASSLALSVPLEYLRTVSQSDRSVAIHHWATR